MLCVNFFPIVILGQINDTDLLLAQGSVSQKMQPMRFRSRSSSSKMLQPSCCPARSHYWSVAQVPQDLAKSNCFLDSSCLKILHVLYDKVKDCLDHSALPMDGATLTEALHQRGINVRYLGSVLEFVEKTPAKAQLEHIYVSLI